MMDWNADKLFEEIAFLIKSADAVAIFAGAGMGVDSGLEQYRGTDGIWTKTLRINDTKVNYYDLMKPVAFREDPALAWGFIGNRMTNYQNTLPHAGFAILHELLYEKEYFIITSNVDEHFQKAGFHKNRIFEVHGSIFNTQCMYNLECGVWRTPPVKILSDGITASSPYPDCPVCNSYCRPNVYLFDDDFFVPDIAAEQQFRYMEWREYINSEYLNTLALEIGAGQSIPTIRKYAERFAGDDHPLVRINPNDHVCDQARHISVPFNALQSLLQIKQHIDRGTCPF